MWLRIAWNLLPYILGASIAGGAVWEIQGARIESRDADIKVQANFLKAAQKANANNRQTIAALQRDVKHANSLCSTQLAVEKKKTDRIAYIDGLKGEDPAPVKTNTMIEKYDVKGGVPNESDNQTAVDTDPLYVELNGMFHGSDAGNRAAAHKEGSPPGTPGAIILSCAVDGGGPPVRLYCLDEEGAKNLLKNQALDSAYQEELLNILDTLKGNGQVNEKSLSIEPGQGN